MKLLLIILCFFALASEASGQVYATDQPVNDKLTQYSLRLAEEIWGPVCPDGKHLYLTALPAANAWVNAEEPCVMWLSLSTYVNTPWSRIRRCSDIVHEYRHWMLTYTDEDHSLDVHSIMSAYSYPNIVVWGCYTRFMPKSMRKKYKQKYGPLTWATK